MNQSLRISIVQFILVATSLWITLSATSAHAALLDGKTVEYTYFFPDTSVVYNGPIEVTVGAGVEILVGGSPEITLDIYDTGFTVNFLSSIIWAPAGFNGFRISDIYGVIAPFTSFTQVNSIEGQWNPGITFDENNLYVNWENLEFHERSLIYAVTTAPIPEPKSYAMLLAGLGLVGFATRKRQRL